MKNKLFITELPIETERLIIKPTTRDDIDLLLKLDKQETTQQFLGGIKNKTKKERLEFLNKKEQKFNQGINSSMTVYLKESNIPIGFVGTKIDENENSSEISYIFDEDYTKKGYCTESMKKIIEICFNKIKLSKIYADIIEKNESSKRVLLKLGFSHIGMKTKNNIVFDKYELYNENN